VIPTVVASLNKVPGYAYTATEEGMGWALFWVAGVVAVIAGSVAGLLRDE
jgi:hypothetical protein